MCLRTRVKSNRACMDMNTCGPNFLFTRGGKGIGAHICRHRGEGCHRCFAGLVGRALDSVPLEKGVQTAGEGDS